MTLQAKQILQKALLLPPVERAELIEMIFRSFGYVGNTKIDALWAKEAESRISSFEKGRLKAVSAEKVFKRLEKTT